MTNEVQSVNRFRSFSDWVDVFKPLDEQYRVAAEASLRKFCRFEFASRQCQYAKVLMGAGEIEKARYHLLQSLRNSFVPISPLKYLSLLLCSYLPTQRQPHWPSRFRS